MPTIESVIVGGGVKGLKPLQAQSPPIAATAPASHARVMLLTIQRTLAPSHPATLSPSPILGWTLLFIGLSLLIGLATGAVFDALVRRGHLPGNPSRAALAAAAPLPVLWREFRQSIRFSVGGCARLLHEGFAGSRVVIRWTLFGLVLAALIRAVLPADSFATWFGATMGGLWLTLLATTVIEVCSEGATPIAADLMNRAGAPGNSFTFLMAGVATDYTEIMSIRDTTASWRLAR